MNGDDVIAATGTVTPMIVDDCGKEAKASFRQKLEAAWDKVEAGSCRLIISLLWHVLSRRIERCERVPPDVVQ